MHLLECGLLRGWLIPPADIKAARDVIRYRRKLVEHRTSKLQRLGNVLQDAGIKADSVASSVTPKSVRAMVEALIDGERRPAVLADLARGSMRSKIPDLQRALEGRFDCYPCPEAVPYTQLTAANIISVYSLGVSRSVKKKKRQKMRTYKRNL
nr:hypothetical protein [Mycobacterium tuberculosis]